MIKKGEKLCYKNQYEKVAVPTKRMSVSNYATCIPFHGYHFEEELKRLFLFGGVISQGI